VLEYFTGSSMFFLNTLPVQLKPCIRDLVITKLILAADDGPSRAAWERNETGLAFFTDFLADSFPNFRTVAIEVPGTYEGMEWNCNTASDCLCDFLFEGRLDTVQFFYDEDSEHSRTDDTFLKCVALERAVSDEESDDENDETDLNGVEELLYPFH
jgi:hypothetical protein